MIERIKTENREQWLKLRGAYIGGSDAGAVVGMNPYKGAYTLWAEKTGRIAPFAGNITTETGTYLEEFVARLFERETGKKVRRDNYTLVNDLYPWACADVDRRIVGENALLECKTTTSLSNTKLFKHGEYPESWYCQMMHYMAVTGAKRCYLAVLISCREFKWFRLERDETEINALMDAERAFYEYIKTDTEPPATGADGDAVRDASGTGADGTLDLTAERNLLDEYASLQSTRKDIDTQLDDLKARICQSMGAYETGIADGYRVTWKTQSRNSFDAKAFAAAHPAIDLNPYYKASTSRVFKIESK